MSASPAAVQAKPPPVTLEAGASTSKPELADIDIENELLPGLWQEAQFARLPDDAPPEIRAYVRDIENPRRVYAIHRATRRHDFQSLVDR